MDRSKNRPKRNATVTRQITCNQRTKKTSSSNGSFGQLRKKDTEWKWTEEHTEAFKKIKQRITELPCLAHHNSNYPNILTKDTSTKGLGATLWQEQPDGKMKQIGFASRFLSDTKKKNAINEMKLLGVVWGLERVPPICLRETDKITHGPPSTRTIN